MDSATTERALALGIDLDAILGAVLTTKQVAKIPADAVRITPETMELYGFKSAKGLGKRFAAMGKRTGVTFRVRSGNGPEGEGIYVWKVTDAES